MAPAAAVHHRFLRYRAFPGAHAVVGLVSEDEASVSAILNPATGVAYSELFDIIEDHPYLPAEYSFPSVSGSKRDLSQVEVLAPLPGRDIICIGKNYVEHAKEFNQSGFDASDKKDQPEYPVFFTKRASSIVSNGHPIYLHPSVTSSVDYEGELGIIIGRGGIGIKKEDAWKHVWGAIIINDVTARERQRDHKQFYIGKSLDTFCPMGAYVVPSSSLSFQDLHLTTKVNGEIRQSQNTSELIFDIPILIGTASMGITLQPGDIIATGTPFGTGMAKPPGTWLKEGDIVEVSIPPLGVLRTPVVSPNISPLRVDPVRTRTFPGTTSNGDAYRMLIGSPPKALHVEVSGPEDGMPVLFFHGLCCSLQYYSGAVELAGLAKTHRVILFDLEGHGQSPLSSQAHNGLSMEQFADDAKAILDNLGMQTCHIVAHSMGGLIATIFAAKYPDVVKNMVLFSPLSIHEGIKQHLTGGTKEGTAALARSSGMTAIANLWAPSGISSHTQLSNPVAKMFVRQTQSHMSVDGFALACGAISRARDPDFTRIRAETVIIVIGREEMLAAKEIADFLESAIKGARVESWENMGHWPMLEDVERTAKLLAESL